MDMRATAPDGHGHGILKIPNPVQSYPEPSDLNKTLGGEMYKVSLTPRASHHHHPETDFVFCPPPPPIAGKYRFQSIPLP